MNKTEEELENYKRMIGFDVDEEEFEKMYDVKNILKEAKTIANDEFDFAKIMSEKDAFFLHLIELTSSFPKSLLEDNQEFDEVAADMVSEWGAKICRYFHMRTIMLNTLELYDANMNAGKFNINNPKSKEKLMQDIENEVCDNLIKNIEKYDSMGEKAYFKDQYGFLPDETALKDENYNINENIEKEIVDEPTSQLKNDETLSRSGDIKQNYSWQAIADRISNISNDYAECIKNYAKQDVFFIHILSNIMSFPLNLMNENKEYTRKGAEELAQWGDVICRYLHTRLIILGLDELSQDELLNGEIENLNDHDEQNLQKIKDWMTEEFKRLNDSGILWPKYEMDKE